MIEKIKVINKSNNPLPEYSLSGDAGMDLRAELYGVDKVILKPSERLLIKTGLFMQLPENIELQIRSRSGLSLKQGIIVLNSPGTIDPNYTGEIGVILYNSGKEDFEINQGDRIAQGVFSEFKKISFTSVYDLEETSRGSGGFGSTGVK